MVQKEIKGSAVIFRRGSEAVALFPKKSKYNAIYQKWWGDVKVSHIIAELNNVNEWIEKEQLTKEEFEKLIELIRENAIFW